MVNDDYMIFYIFINHQLVMQILKVCSYKILPCTNHHTVSMCVVVALHIWRYTHPWSPRYLKLSISMAIVAVFDVYLMYILDATSVC